ncbi:hypothetical protein D3C80_985670 [compost metagenome]
MRGAVKQQRITEGNRRVANALARCLCGRHLLHGGIQHLQLDIADLPLCIGGNQSTGYFAQQHIRLVAAAGIGLRNVFGNEAGCGGGRFTGAQMRDQRVAEGDCKIDDPPAGNGIGHILPALQHGALACQRARHGHQRAPLLARLPPAVVTGIGAKAEEHRKCDTEQRKWRAIQRRHQIRPVLVRPDHHRRQQENGKHLRKDADDDGAAQDGEKLQQVRLWTNDHGGDSKCL